MCLLCHKLNTCRTSLAHFHFIFPTGRRTEEADYGEKRRAEKAGNCKRRTKETGNSKAWTSTSFSTCRSDCRASNNSCFSSYKTRASSISSTRSPGSNLSCSKKSSSLIALFSGIAIRVTVLSACNCSCLTVRFLTNSNLQNLPQYFLKLPETGF